MCIVADLNPTSIVRPGKNWSFFKNPKVDAGGGKSNGTNYLPKTTNVQANDREKCALKEFPKGI